MDKKSINILIIGAGLAGELLYKNIKDDKESAFNVVGFIDDAKNKKNAKIGSVKVLGKIEDIGGIAKEHKVKEIIIAIPSERGETIRRVVQYSMGLGLTYKILPRISEVLLQDYDKDYLRYVRRIKAEDLLGGEILKSDQEGIEKNLKNEVVLITGAAGSIGSELSRQVTAYGAKKVIFYDWWENGMYDLEMYIKENYPERNCEFIIGDIKDKKKLDAVMKHFKPTTIFHAAAYKHVPLMESNVSEAVKNNILGTKIVAETAIKNKVSKFVLISTDKAVNPTNVMGATKRAAEKVINILSKSQNKTIFFAVRFGNVINSNGSAIPLFERQIETGGPVTVTHKEVTRFFMTISEAVHLILQAWSMGKNNDLFVLDMGEPVKIYELANMLITLHGYVPGKDIKIKIIGLRPGEKLYEEVLVEQEETSSTSVKKVFRTKNYLSFDRLVFLSNLSIIKEVIEEDGMNRTDLKEILQIMISTYNPQNETKILTS